MAHNCESCTFRKAYDKKPGSLLGRLWRWHINWCPGWKKYMKDLSDGERERLAQIYRLSKN